MKHSRFIPSTLNVDTPLDCRRLSLTLFFYSLDYCHSVDLCSQLMFWVQNQVENQFFFKWSCNGKKTSQKCVKEKLSNPFPMEYGLSIGFDSYCICEKVFDLNSLKKYQREIQSINPAYQFGWPQRTFGDNSSIDFPDYIDTYFPKDRTDTEEIRHSIYKLFQEPNRRFLSLHSMPDLYGFFTAKPYKMFPERFYGQATISFSAFCLGEALDCTAEAFAVFAQQLAELFTQVNVHVSLQPPNGNISPYMRYYGKHVLADGSHKDAMCSIEEWYSTYYLCGVEWLNIISPLTKHHIMLDALNLSFRNDICLQELSSGGLMIKSQKPISAYSENDSYALKKILVPALFPGRSSVPLRGLFPWKGEHKIYDWCPRNDWAIVPVEEEEIQIVGTDIVFISKNALRE